MGHVLLRNYVYLTENLTNFHQVLVYLVQHNVISLHEKETLLLPHKVSLVQNSELLELLQRKDWMLIEQVFIRVLKITGNEHCANIIQHDSNVDSSLYSEIDEAEGIWFEVPTATRYYIGRTDEMNEIDKYWRDSFMANILMFVTITGLGGVGKSEVAKNYALKFYGETKGNCIWIDAETPESVMNSFSNLASEFQIPLKDSTGNEKLITTLIKEVYAKMSIKLRSLKCILIFDNVETYETNFIQLLIEASRRLKPKQCKPFVIVTSRFAPAVKYLGYYANQIALDVLKREDAESFLLQALGASLENTSAIKNLQRLAERLNFFPLAMQQAVAFINAKKLYSSLDTEIQNYLDKIETESKHLLDYPLPLFQTLGENFKTTYLTWRVTLAKLISMETVGKAVEKSTKVISFFSPDHISTSFVLKIISDFEEENARTEKWPKTELLVNDTPVFEILSDYSMCKFTGGKDAQEKTVSIHRLVQEVIRIDLTEEDKIEVIDFCIQRIQKMLLAKEIPLNQMIHVVTLWNHAVEHQGLIKKHKEFSNWICKKYDDDGKFLEVFNFSKEAGEVFKRILGENDSFSLRMEYWNADSLYERGQYKETAEIFKNLHERQKSILGETNAYTLDSANSVGKSLKKAGDTEEAMFWFKYTLERREKHFGADHRDTLVLKNNVATILASQNKNEEALLLFREVFDAKIKKFGYENSDTLITERNIGSVLLNDGKFQEALEVFERISPIEMQILEANHSLTLKTLYLKAVALNGLRKYDEAMEVHKFVYEKRLESFGLENASTIQSFQSIQRLEKIVKQIKI